VAGLFWITVVLYSRVRLTIIVVGSSSPAGHHNLGFRHWKMECMAAATDYATNHG